MHCKAYTNSDNQDVFYRVLVVPEEENIMLLAENISVGDEGGLKLVKLSRLTDDHSVLPKFGLATVDSLKFIDSINIQRYFNGKKITVNLDKVKKYHLH